MANRNHRIALTFAVTAATTVLLGFALVAAPTKAQVLGAVLPPQNPLSRIAWLVGSWRTVELAGSSPSTLEMEGKWSADMNSILVTCNRVSEDQKISPFYKATYSWDSQNKKIVVKQTFSNGDRFEGEARPIAVDFAQVGKLIRPDGTMENVQTRYVNWSPDTFSIEVTSPGQTAHPLGTGLDLVYLRQKPQSAPGLSAPAPVPGPSAPGPVSSLRK